MPDGMFYGVGVGPGDPELMTLQAVKIISRADIIAVPSGGERQTALGSAAAYIEGKQILDCPIPMTRDGGKLDTAYIHNADNICMLLTEGKSVAYITLGDPSIYSTYSPLREIVKSRGFTTYTVPGVTSFCAAAAVINKPLCKGKQSLLLVPMNDKNIEQCIDFKASKVFMRPSKSIAELKSLLYDKGYTDRCHAITNCGLPGERIYESLDEMDDTGYFTLIFVRE